MTKKQSRRAVQLTRAERDTINHRAAAMNGGQGAVVRYHFERVHGRLTLVRAVILAQAQTNEHMREQKLIKKAKHTEEATA